MKLLNATDKKTPKLEQFGLVDRGISVNGKMLRPGKFIDVTAADKARLEAEHAHLFDVGALVWEEAPKNALVELKAPAAVEAPKEEPKEEKKKGR